MTEVRLAHEKRAAAWKAYIGSVTLTDEGMRADVLTAFEAGYDAAVRDFDPPYPEVRRALDDIDAERKSSNDTRVDRMIQALIVRGVTAEEYARAWREPHEVPCAVRRYTSEPKPGATPLTFENRRLSSTWRDGYYRSVPLSPDQGGPASEYWMEPESMYAERVRDELHAKGPGTEPLALRYSGDPKNSLGKRRDVVSQAVARAEFAEWGWVCPEGTIAEYNAPGPLPEIGKR